jgi:hypothetical protein
LTVEAGKREPKANANKRTTRDAIHLGIKKHQERSGIVSGDEPRRATQFRSDIVFPDPSHQCEAEAIQKNIRTGSQSGILSPHGFASKHPTHAAEKTSSWAELRCEDADSSSVSQLVALIKNVGYVEPELERAVFGGKMK